MQSYYRPIVSTEAHRPDDALPLAGGWGWFNMVEQLSRDAPARLCHVFDLPDDVCARLTDPRDPVAGLAMDRPNLMGILNVTPDSFSDGGQFLAPDAALAQARALIDGGADILDIGGESTRPGAAVVPVDEEIARTAPVIAALREQGLGTPISIDTRKAPVAEAALAAGADLVNDVAAFTYDPAIGDVAARHGAPVCLMHAQGTPETMQADPRYDNIVLDVYDFLEERVQAATAMGLTRAQIMVDPGIGFGKTVDHNLALIRNISLFHGLGCPLLLGASRKRFIGALSDAPDAADRVAGSVSVALAGLAQGVQFLRVHDIKETRQAVTLSQAVWGEL